VAVSPVGLRPPCKTATIGRATKPADDPLIFCRSLFKQTEPPLQWAGEGVATFGLILTILATLRARPEVIPASVALYIFAACWFTSSTSFANPAITIARSFTNTFTGISPVDIPGFVIAQIAGALAAMGAARVLFADAQESGPRP